MEIAQRRRVFFIIEIHSESSVFFGVLCIRTKSVYEYIYIYIISTIIARFFLRRDLVLIPGSDSRFFARSVISFIFLTRKFNTSANSSRNLIASCTFTCQSQISQTAALAQMSRHTRVVNFISWRLTQISLWYNNVDFLSDRLRKYRPNTVN